MTEHSLAVFFFGDALLQASDARKILDRESITTRERERACWRSISDRPLVSRGWSMLIFFISHPIPFLALIHFLSSHINLAVLTNFPMRASQAVRYKSLVGVI